MWSKYNYINTLELIGKLDSYLMCDNSNNFPYTALDTETNGLLIYKASIIGFSLSINSTQGFYIPLVEWIPNTDISKQKTVNKKKYTVYTDGHFKCVWTGNTYPEFFKPTDYIMPEFIPVIISRWFTNTNLILHNAPFDINHIFTMTGVDLTNSVFLDTALLSHILNENSFNGLKETANEWREELGINPHIMANQEQKELGTSVLLNGGAVTAGNKAKSVWRADPLVLSKYACADTFLTYGLFEVGLSKLDQKFGEKGFKWVFEEEVMPVCKEVVIPLKRKGVYTDLPHFIKAEKETADMLVSIEDSIINEISDYIDDFSIGKSIDEYVSDKKLILKIIELEGLSVPVKINKKTGEGKETLAKADVKKQYEENPHWIWGYILGEDELKYSDDKIYNIKKQLYEEGIGRRYRFNIGSDAHLRWLFCDKLGMSKTDLPQTDSATKDNPIPSMKAEVLQEFMLPSYKWVHDLLVFKKLRKLHSTYIKPVLNLNIDGWLYMDMKQNGTVSGRFACSGGFNLQTLPNIENEMETLKQCNKCDSHDVTVIQKIEALADRKCNTCNYIEHDIICSSVIKKGFIAPPGYKIINADYASLEPRCFAYMSGDVKLKEVYWNGLDLYSKVYCDVFDTEHQYSADPKAPNFLKTLNKSARTETKPIVLGIPYGANAYQVASLTGKTKTIDKEGQKIEIPDVAYGQWVIDKYLGTYKDLHKYMDKQEIDCLHKGYVEALCGRRRHFQYAPKIYKFLLLKGLTYKDLVNAKPSVLSKPDVSFVSEYGKKVTFSSEELKVLMKDIGLSYDKCIQKRYWVYVRNLLKADLNNAKNFPIQALAGHITNRAMLESTRLFKESNLDAWVCLQVHDEIMGYTKDSTSELAANCLKVGMENNLYAIKIDVPMIAEPVICNNAKEAK